MSSYNTNTYATKGSVISMEKDKDKEKETIEIDKELYLSLIQGKNSTDFNISEEENNASNLGLFKVYAYYCYRCHHVWLPRYISGYNPFAYNEIVLNSEPPKSCAKCKSKSWLKIP